MKKIQSFLQSFSIEEKYTPLLFLAIGIAAFGLQANRLGYYQDDWPYIFYAFNKGISSLKESLFFDSRPNSAWLYISLFTVLGFKPLAWQITALIFRWLTATVLWYFFKLIWPAYSRQVTFVIAIFVVHPFFIIQPEAVNSILYWAGYLLFAISLLIMAYNFTSGRNSILLIAVAVFLEGLHLFTSEYFVGVTLIRPLILFWLISRDTQGIKNIITKVIKEWVPYTLALATYVLWRLFLFVPPPRGDRNAPKVLIDLIKHPFTALPGFIQTALQDVSMVAVTSWYKTFQADFFSFSTPFTRANIFLFFLVLGFVFIYFNKIKHETNESTSQDWSWAPFTLGLAILFLSLAPIWAVGQDISTHVNQYAASRFGIVATLGASLILVAIIDNFIRDYKKAALAIAFLIALATQMHLNNENGFAYSWEKQENLFRQLLWRAPELKPGTALVTDEEVLGFMGDYAVSFEAMTSYQVGNIKTPPYWYFPFYYGDPNINDFLLGIPLDGKKLSMQFDGNSKQYLLLSFNPEQNRCLWILQPQDANLRLISKDMSSLSLGSDINSIQYSNKDPQLPEKIFGPQSPLTQWCYYFQKADLARQVQHWDEIPTLMEKAKASGVHSNNGFEFIPFIEGYAHVGDWKQAKLLTISAYKITSDLEPSLCSALDRIATTTAPSAERDQTISDLKDNLRCSDFQ